MDAIAFHTRTSNVEDYQVTDIYINGANLTNILYSFEYKFAEAEGQAGLAGQYEGLPPLMVLPPSPHFLGRPQEEAYLHPDGRITLMEYAQSGVPGDWTMCCYIHVGDQTVVWDGFCQTQRPHWDYSELGPFVFERTTYEEALEYARQEAY
jgi:hypothetical protein